MKTKNIFYNFANHSIYHFCAYFIVALILIGSSFSASANSFTEEKTPFASSSLYIPSGEVKGGVIVLHGSEGGSLPFNKLEAQYFASNGYVTLAFCWYNCGKNPILSSYDSLENIELRKTIQAIDWLKKIPSLTNKKIALTGFSRGAEQSMVLGSLTDSIALLDVIAVHTPSDIIEPGVNWNGADKRCWLCPKGDLSCFNNSNNFMEWDYQNMNWNPACGTLPKYPDDPTNIAWILDGVPLPKKSIIEIEKFKKPILITVGDKDELWDYKKSVRLADRLKANNQPVELHIFPGEFHNFSIANENIRHDLVLKFFDKYLK